MGQETVEFLPREEGGAGEKQVVTLGRVLLDHDAEAAHQLLEVKVQRDPGSHDGPETGAGCEVHGNAVLFEGIEDAKV